MLASLEVQKHTFSPMGKFQKAWMQKDQDEGLQESTKANSKAKAKGMLEMENFQAME
jgi:hypothetical protein